MRPVRPEGRGGTETFGRLEIGGVSDQIHRDEGAIGTEKGALGFRKHSKGGQESSD